MITTVQIHHDCGVHIPFFLGTTQDNSGIGWVMLALMRRLMQLEMCSNCISAPMSKQVGNKLSTSVKNRISQRDVAIISLSEEWFLSCS